MSPGAVYELHAEAEQHHAGAWVGLTVAAFAAVLGLLGLWQWSRLRKYSIGER